MGVDALWIVAGMAATLGFLYLAARLVGRGWHEEKMNFHRDVLQDMKGKHRGED